MTRPILWTVGGMIALGLVAVVVIWRSAPDAAVPSAGEVEAPALEARWAAADLPVRGEGPVVAAPEARNERTRVVLFGPLPPLDVPVEGIVGELQERAEAGDAVAACRLAAELARCASVQQFDAEATAEALLLTVRIDADGGRHVERNEQYIAGMLRRQEQCRGLDPALLHGRARYDLMAAQLGDLDAAFRFVSADSLETATLLRDPELLHLYRQHAWPLFLQLLEAGHPYAPGLWAKATRRRSNALAAVLPPEWDRPEVARTLHERVAAPPLYPSSPPPPSPEAVAEADRLYRDYFADAPARGAGTLPPPPPLADPAGCEAPDRQWVR